MKGAVELELWQFSLVYVLLLIVIFIMKKCKVKQTKLLLTASIRMTLQLVIAGLLLTYIFKNPHIVFTLSYLGIMTGFAVYRVISKNKDLNKRFLIRIGLAVALPGIFTIVFFVYLIVGSSLSNPQYVIPVSGMIMGNTMTGATLGIKTFRESLAGQRTRMNALLYMGVDPDRILMPFVRQALETALMPTMNSMIGMGIVSLPGMMTGQILSGTLPMTAILYQIAIMISICTVVAMSSFGALYLGYKTLYNKRKQWEFV